LWRAFHRLFDDQRPDGAVHKLKSRKNQDGFVAMLMAQQRAMRKDSYNAPEYIENV